jgi:hypothetical protein
MMDDASTLASDFVHSRDDNKEVPASRKRPAEQDIDGQRPRKSRRIQEQQAASRYHADREPVVADEDAPFADDEDRDEPDEAASEEDSGSEQDDPTDPDYVPGEEADDDR